MDLYKFVKYSPTCDYTNDTCFSESCPGNRAGAEGGAADPYIADNITGLFAGGTVATGLYSSVFFNNDFRLTISDGVEVVLEIADFALLTVVGVSTPFRADSKTCIHGLSTRR